MSDACTALATARIVMETCRYCGAPADGAWHAACNDVYEARYAAGNCTYCGEPATDNGMYCDGCRNVESPTYVGYPKPTEVGFDLV